MDVSNSDVLELMAAANFFQLDGLLKYTEARAAAMVDVDNIVSMYIHAKVSLNCLSPFSAIFSAPITESGSFVTGI